MNFRKHLINVICYIIYMNLVGRKCFCLKKGRSGALNLHFFFVWAPFFRAKRKKCLRFLLRVIILFFKMLRGRKRRFGDSFGGVANVSCYCMHTKNECFGHLFTSVLNKDCLIRYISLLRTYLSRINQKITEDLGRVSLHGPSRQIGIVNLIPCFETSFYMEQIGNRYRKKIFVTNLPIFVDNMKPYAWKMYNIFFISSCLKIVLAFTDRQ